MNTLKNIMHYHIDMIIHGTTFVEPLGGTGWRGIRELQKTVIYCTWVWDIKQAKKSDMEFIITYM